MYLGHSPTNAGSFIFLDDIASGFNGSETQFTLQVGGVNITPNTQNLLISLDGIIQQAPDAYTVSGSTITFTGAVPSGTDFYGILMGQSASIGQGTIGADELKISGNGTSGQLLKSDGDGTYSYVNQSAVTADANVLSGTTLKSTVVNSSLTSVGTLTSLTTGAITQNAGTFTVKNASSDSNGLKIFQDSGDASKIYNHYNGTLQLGVGNTTALTIDSSERVGVVTTSPDSIIHAKVTTNTSETIRIQNDDSLTTVGVSSDGYSFHTYQHSLYWASWDGSTWSTKARLTNDGEFILKGTSLPQDFGDERGQLAISSVDNAGANNYAVLQLQGHSIANDVATGGIYFYDHSNNTATIQTQRDDSTSKGNIIFYTNGGSGVTARAQITSDGYVKHLNQPAFHAYGFSGNNHIYANQSAKDPIVYVNTDLNQGSHYSTSTGKFTAPVAGVYHFYMNAMYKHYDGDFVVFIKVNGTTYTVSNNHQEYNGSDLHTWVQTTTHLTIALSANDYVTTGFGSSDNTQTFLYGAGRYNSFGGHMVA